MSAIINGLHNIKEGLYRNLIPEKLNNPLGYVLGIGLGLFCALVFTFLPLKIALGLVGLAIGIPLLGACFIDIKIGIWLILIFGFFVSFLSKYVDAPFGIGLDALIFLLGFSLLVQVSASKDMNWVRHPISYFALVWIGLSFLQVLNPAAGSRMAWVYTVRSIAVLLFLYFIACYAFQSKKIIFNTLTVVLSLGFLASLYACKQEFIGFSSTELNWVRADPKRFQLIFQWSRLRVFSFFSDCTTYGILAAYIGVMTAVMALGPYTWLKRILLLTCTLVSFMGMAFAGSRTPFVLVPVGFFFYIILTLNRYVIAGAVVAGVLFAGLMLKSTSNAVIYRMQSAFTATTTDASVQVRIDNQKLIQPTIHSHPIGTGLGSTGEWAERFTPDSWLASFAHDSGFVRIAVEMGWIGLIYYMLMLFVIMRYGVYYYYRVRDPMIKNMYAAILCALFMLILASYPQEAIVMLPTSLFFYILLAALVRMKDFDETYQLILQEEQNRMEEMTRVVIEPDDINREEEGRSESLRIPREKTGDGELV